MFIFLVIAVGVCTDILSCRLELEKNRQAAGASGLPAMTLIACYLLPLLLRGEPVLTPSVWLDAGVFTVFHVTVVIAIPAIHRKRLASRAAAKKTA
jgi:hypothetical protein